LAYFLTKRALKDLDEIADYLSQNFPDKGEVTYSLIHEFCKYLCRHPQMGRLNKASSIREAVMARLPYRIYYQSRGKDIAVLRIHHTTRQKLH
jgi:addiction module RelE/StbE family toxin